MRRTWTVPRVTRTREPNAADERATLDGLLDWHRSTFWWKCEGLTGGQLARRPGPPPPPAPPGAGRRAAASDEAKAATAAADLAALRAEQELCRRAVAGVALDTTFEHEQWGTLSVRWVHNHMIAEYARHLG